MLGFVAVAGVYLGAADWVAQKIVNFVLERSPLTPRLAPFLPSVSSRLSSRAPDPLQPNPRRCRTAFFSPPLNP